MKEKTLLTSKQIDFLREIINIGAGNAAAAFSQMLHCMIDLKIPEIYFFPASQLPPFLKDPVRPFAGVSMNMIGDVKGKLFYLVQDERKERLVEIMQHAAPGGGNESGVTVDLTVLEEIGNILAGVFLVSIHDFCRLNIYHTVPELRIDMIQALLDESIASTAAGKSQIILIESEFVIKEENISTFFLIIPDWESIHKLVDSIENARKKLYEK